jgi:hypothetical protein
LWAHRISRHGATRVTPFELVYGQEAVLPIEVNLGAYRLAKQNDISVDTYHALMVDNIDEVTDKRLEALEAIEKDKRRVARAYNKRVKAKSFQVGDLVWKTILPIGSKSNKFGKWSPSWEGPYKVVKVCYGNSYMVVLGGFGIEPSHTQKIENGHAKDAGSKTPEVADSISTLRASRFGGHLSSPPKPSTRIQLSTRRQSLAWRLIP